jgi:hypothetical protein
LIFRNVVDGLARHVAAALLAIASGVSVWRTGSHPILFATLTASPAIVITVGSKATFLRPDPHGRGTVAPTHRAIW